MRDWQELTRMSGDETLVIEKVGMPGKGISIEGSFDLPPLAKLSMEDQVFVSAFVRSHGSIKQMEKLFGISYPTVKNLLNRIARKLITMGSKIRIRIEGHTDSTPLRARSPYKDNWDLSTQRALSVIRYLADRHGFARENLIASGYGEFAPVASNTTAEGRARNRRVDIVILNEKYAALEPSRGEGA